MPGRLVNVDVERKHELEVAESLVEATTIRVRQYRIAGHRDEGPHLPCSGRQYFIRDRGGRQNAREFRIALHPRLPTIKWRRAVLEFLGIEHRRDNPDREHRAARPVEISRQDGDEILQPAAKRSEALGAGAGPTVPDRAWGSRECFRKRPNRFRRNSASSGNPIRRKRRGEFTHLFEAFRIFPDPAKIDQVRLEKMMDNAEQEVGVGARQDRDVLIGKLGGLASARIDHDHLAAARADGLDTVWHSRSGHQTPVRDRRIAPVHDEKLGPVDVGHRDHRAIAIHQQGRQNFGNVIHAASAVDLWCSQRLEQQCAVKEQARMVRRRVANVESDGLAPMLVLNRLQPGNGIIERLFPARLFEAAVPLDERCRDDIGIVMQLLHRIGFWADIAAAERIVRITAYAGDRAGLHVCRNQRSAMGLAKRTNPMMSRERSRLERFTGLRDVHTLSPLTSAGRSNSSRDRFSPRDRAARYIDRYRRHARHRVERIHVAVSRDQHVCRRAVAGGIEILPRKTAPGDSH